MFFEKILFFFEKSFLQLHVFPLETGDFQDFFQ